MLEIYAGTKALEAIKEQGFKQEMFTNFLGASGGPKWFTLFGLDKYLFGDFFQGRVNELNLIGSSAGAFRAAALVQQDPVEAITKLAYSYANIIYSKKPTPLEISNSAIKLVEELLSGNRANEIINNKIFKAHFLVAKCNGLAASENKTFQLLGFVQSILLNKVSRHLINKQYQRYIFKAPNSNVRIDDPYLFTNNYQELTQTNIKSALLASGSIPLVMSGVKDIPQAPLGTYRDGGIIDYHFDFSIDNQHQAQANEELKNERSSKKELSSKGLTLYPHFSAKPKAGWFDKNSARKVLAKNYNNTVLICPSQKFINSLPYNKISDRTDFNEMDDSTRIKYWEQVLDRSDQLADSLQAFIEEQDISRIKRFQP